MLLPTRAHTHYHNIKPYPAPSSHSPTTHQHTQKNHTILHTPNHNKQSQQSTQPGEIAKPNAPHKPLPDSAGELAVARLDRLRNANGNLKTAEIRRTMQKVMQSNAAVFRTQETLEEGCRLIDDAVASFADVKVRAWVCVVGG